MTPISPPDDAGASPPDDAAASADVDAVATAPDFDAVASAELHAVAEAAHTAEVAAAKREARTRIRAIRRGRAPWSDDDSRRTAEAAALAEGVLAGAADRLEQPGTTVASYVALPTEPGTSELHRRLLHRGLRVIVPILLPDKDLDWAELAPDGVTAGPALGLEEIGRASLIVVPALAVDREGFRLGQGGGSYDRALARRDPSALVVALIDDEGLLEHVPSEPHDARVAAVVRPATPWTSLPQPAAICENRGTPD